MPKWARLPNKPMPCMDPTSRQLSMRAPSSGTNAGPTKDGPKQTTKGGSYPRNDLN